MSTFLAYSDESGKYEARGIADRLRGSGDIRRFYGRSVLLLSAADWPKLQELLETRKRESGFESVSEVKWNHCWAAVQAKRRGDKIAETKPHSYMQDKDESAICAYLQNVLEGILKLDSAKYLFTVSRVKRTAHSFETIEKWHLQNSMQRIQMEMEAKSTEADRALALMFFDSRNERGEAGARQLRELYYRMFKNGDFVKYTHIVDSLHFQDSQYSAGIQCADYLAGCFVGALTGNEQSKEWFRRYIRPKLRMHSDNNRWRGYGVIGIPKLSYIDPEVTELLDA